MSLRPVPPIPSAVALTTALLAAGLLAAPVTATLTTAAAAQGADCAGPIAAFQTIIDNDKRTGNLNGSVHRRIVAELAGATAACAGGQAVVANARLRAVKSRYGYH